VAVGTSAGVIQMYKWDWFGDCKSRLVRHASSIDCMVKYDEETLIAGCEDGWVRLYGLNPMKFRVFENHSDDLDQAMGVDAMSMSRCKKILGSLSDDCCVRFYDISNLKDFLEEDKTDWEQVLEETVCHTKISDKKKNNKTKNVEFFGDF